MWWKLRQRVQPVPVAVVRVEEAAATRACAAASLATADRHLITVLNALSISSNAISFVMTPNALQGFNVEIAVICWVLKQQHPLFASAVFLRQTLRKKLSPTRRTGL
ncbi:hypothetical protein SELMODRAFT_416240 [Selaginella moellendorffii]|uniref:Uncharacterized protein n=1 Tax=Selaginella moellendorffii TaxID=88036 RepID=D8RYN3_SELML|nr:hypothetical protein SELMODRAFT_416240 [Selaginella moellendorffii]